MKYLLFALVPILAGCASVSERQSYYEASKAISKDQTIIQSACYATVGEIAKNGDNSVKIGAIALAERCKNEGIKLEPPKKSWLLF